MDDIRNLLLSEIRNNKYMITAEQCKMIREQRNHIGLSADNISIKMNVARCWLACLERGEFKSIKGDKLLKLFKIIFAKTDVLDEIKNFLMLNLS